MLTSPALSNKLVRNFKRRKCAICIPGKQVYALGEFVGSAISKMRTIAISTNGRQSAEAEFVQDAGGKNVTKIISGLRQNAKDGDA